MAVSGAQWTVGKAKEVADFGIHMELSGRRLGGALRGMEAHCGIYEDEFKYKIPEKWTPENMASARKVVRKYVTALKDCYRRSTELRKGLLDIRSKLPKNPTDADMTAMRRSMAEFLETFGFEKRLAYGLANQMPHNMHIEFVVDGLERAGQQAIDFEQKRANSWRAKRAKAKADVEKSRVIKTKEKPIDPAEARQLAEMEDLAQKMQDNKNKIQALQDEQFENQRKMDELQEKINAENEAKSKMVKNKATERYIREHDARIESFKAKQEKLEARNADLGIEIEAIDTQNRAIDSYRIALDESSGVAVKLEQAAGDIEAHARQLANEFAQADKAEKAGKTPKRSTTEINVDITRNDLMAERVQAEIKNAAKARTAAWDNVHKGRWAQAADDLGRSIKSGSAFFKALAIAGGAFSAYAAYGEYEKAYQSAKFGSWEVARQDLKSAGMYTAETAALGLEFSKRAALRKVAERTNMALIPVTFVATEIIKHNRERHKMSAADWAKTYQPTDLFNEFYSTSTSGGFAEGYLMTRKARNALGKRTGEWVINDEELYASKEWVEAMNQNQREKAMVMYEMYRALIGLSNSTGVIEALNENKKANEVNQAIGNNFTPYHDYFFWHMDLTQISSQADVRNMINHANQFSFIMEQRELKEGTQWNIGGVNLLSKRYDLNPSKIPFMKEPWSESNFDPMEVVRAYNKGKEQEIHSNLSKAAQTNIAHMPTNYLLYLFSKNSQLLNSGELSEAEIKKIETHQEALAYELENNRNVILSLDAGKPEFFIASSKEDILAHNAGLEKQKSTPFEMFEAMNKHTNSGVHALYKAALVLGYQRGENEVELRQFFSKDKADYYGIYWDEGGKTGWSSESGQGVWKIQEAGMEMDHRMGKSLNGLTIKYMIDFMKKNRDDVLKSRMGDMFNMTGSQGFEAQIDLVTRALEEGLNESYSFWNKKIEVPEDLKGASAMDRYKEVIENGVKSIDGMQSIYYEIESEAQILISAPNHADRRIRRVGSGDEWTIENVDHKKLTLAQAVMMTNLINKTEHLMEEEAKRVKGEEPFYVADSGDIEIKTRRMNPTALSDLEFGPFWDVYMSRQQVVEVLNAWYSTPSQTPWYQPDFAAVA